MQVGDLVKHKGWKGYGVVVKLVRECKYTSKHDVFMVLCRDGYRNMWQRRDCEVVSRSESTSV